MKYLLIFLLIIIIITVTQVYCDSNLPIGYKVNVAVPNLYSSGFIGKAFIMETDEKEPNFKTTITVQALNEAYCCSIDIFLGNVKVWSSAHSLPFYTSDTCTLELTQSGDLQLRGQNNRLGWRSGTSGQGVKRLQLLRTGNLVLVDAMSLIKWESFNFPTDVMLLEQRLSSRTRLTSFINNSSLYYSFEIHSDKLALYLNSEKWKYSYWELRSSRNDNITFVQLTSRALEIYTGYVQKIAQIKSKKAEQIRFLALGNVISGNLGLYYYSTEKSEFVPYYQAINAKCNFPLACKPYEICTFANSCSCLELIAKRTEPLTDCRKGIPEGLCGSSQAEMLEVRGVTSVLRTSPVIVNVSQETCANMCINDCSCASALYLANAADSHLQECYLYELIRGAKQVDRANSAIFMVKVPKGTHGGGSGLKRWIVILIVVVDGFIVAVVLGGIAYYMIQKRSKNLMDATGQPP